MNGPLAQWTAQGELAFNPTLHPCLPAWGWGSASDGFPRSLTSIYPLSRGINLCLDPACIWRRIFHNPTRRLLHVRPSGLSAALSPIDVAHFHRVHRAPTSGLWVGVRLQENRAYCLLTTLADPRITLLRHKARYKRRYPIPGGCRSSLARLSR